MNEAAAVQPPLRHVLVELFAVFNLAFLSVDVAIAHSFNAFAHAAEWIPVGFSLVAALLLLPGLLRRSWRGGTGRLFGLVVGGASIAVGILGMFLHLESTFFAHQSLKNLVYTAPFAGPLAYGGVGFLLLLNRMDTATSGEWGHWVIFLAMAGFVGVFGISLADHAQNGFFAASEWIPVGSAAFAVSFLLTAILRSGDRLFLKLCLALMGAQACVGALGALLHLRADLGGVSDSIWDNLVFGAPVFAPLLLANLAILGAIGLWELLAVNDLAIPESRAV